MDKVLYCRLAMLMVEKDTRLSQAQVAKDTKLSATTINKLYQNRFDRIDKNTVVSLCKYFDCG
ncbi:helix-turn-helix domain-containing protein, partial [Acaryochloris marina NIES-2412]|uniref:helix-turn-helix domain-containing protein n=1 Tax=Acaryochloris marina TaxID=155978 RepID=UPI0040599A7A